MNKNKKSIFDFTPSTFDTFVFYIDVQILIDN